MWGRRVGRVGGGLGSGGGVFRFTLWVVTAVGRSRYPAVFVGSGGVWRKRTCAGVIPALYWRFMDVAWSGGAVVVIRGMASRQSWPQWSVVLKQLVFVGHAASLRRQRS